MGNTWVKLVAATFIGTTLASVVNASPAFAIRFNFFSEFTEEKEKEFPGGSLTGTLAGEDLDNDDFLMGTEITDFFARFTSNDEKIFPSFIQEDVGSSFFGVGSEAGNYNFATQSDEDGGEFGTINVQLGGSSDSNALTVSCTNESLCSSSPLAGGKEVFIDQHQGITLEQVPEPSTTAALMGFAVLGLGGLVKKKKLLSTGFNGSSLR